MEGKQRKLGGRVNGPFGVPMVNMFMEKGLMSSQKPILYPLSGEIGIDKDLFWSINIAKKYGVEMTTLIEILGKRCGNPPTLSESSFLQAYLGENMDEALARGKKPAGVLEGVKKMISDISYSVAHLYGEEIKNAWQSPEEFMKMFEELQCISIERWVQSHDSREITGGISTDDLKQSAYETLNACIKHLYSDSFIENRGMFIPPIKEIKDDIGGKFDDFTEELAGKMKRIFPENKS